jgi:hypothetical protein
MDAMQRREFLIGLGGAAAAIAPRSLRPIAQTRMPHAPPTFMYIGSYTSDARGHGDGISVHHRNSERDPWSLVQVVKDLADPSFLAIDRQGRCLIPRTATAPRPRRIGSMSQRAVEPDQQQATRGTNGVHLAIDGTGRFLALANYATGTLVALPIDADALARAGVGYGDADWNTGPTPDEQNDLASAPLSFDPSGRFIVVPDKGIRSRVRLPARTQRDGKLLPGDPPSVAARAGAAPRHVAFHPTRPFAYVHQRARLDDDDLRFDGRQGRTEAAPDSADRAANAHRQQHRRRSLRGAVGAVRLWIESRPRQHRHLRRRGARPAC